MPQTDPLIAAIPKPAVTSANQPQPKTPAFARRLLDMAALDIGPLRRHRDFRLLFAGQSISFFGGMMTTIALPFQVYTLTHSPLAVGLIGVAQLIPLLTLAFVGGALADAFDRRLLVLITELALAGGSGLLLFNALLPAPKLWALYAIAALAAGLDALQRPSLSALVPRLVETDELPAANTLTRVRQTLGMILGPALAGAIIAGIGLPGAYGIDMATFVISLIALRLMRAVPPAPTSERPSLRGVIEGLRYVGGQPVLLGIFLLDMVAVFFGWPYALFPALATLYSHNGSALPVATALGLLYAAPAVGALLASVVSGWTRRVHRHGWAVILAEGAWGLALVGVGLALSLPVALGCLALVGVADMFSGVFRHVVTAEMVPDALRGRVSSIELVAGTSGPLFGDVESGVVATVLSAPAAMLLGGALCAISVGALALALPSLRRYDNRQLHQSKA